MSKLQKIIQGLVNLLVLWSPSMTTSTGGRHQLILLGSLGQLGILLGAILGWKSLHLPLT